MGEISSASEGDSDPLGRARAIVAFRHRRETIFNRTEDIFSDPAWDMLLDLFIASKTGKVISVSSLGIAARIPATAALRWINVMIANDLFVRTPDPDDARKVLVSLTEMAMLSMEELLS